MNTLKKTKQISSDGNWIIFFDDDNGVRHYFHKMYSIGRVKFSRTKFAIMHDILICNDTLKQVEKATKLYGHPTCSGKIKLMVAQTTL